MQSKKLDLTPIADRMRENPVVKKRLYHLMMLNETKKMEVHLGLQ
jgi:hypothetical protein